MSGDGIGPRCLEREPAGKRGDALAAWVERTGRSRAGEHERGGLRFAFYGRVSTEDHQDPVTSLARQQTQAAALVAGHGRIVASFFDTGQSRTLAWARRPQAAALVTALADPQRGWDAIVIGEYERAFYGAQYSSMAPLFEHYGVQLWMPEVGGRVDYHAEDHEQTMLALGYQSKREITRTRIRVRTAMAAQRPARPSRNSDPPLPAGRAAGLRDLRAAAGVSLVQRQARLPVPPWLHQRRDARPSPAQEPVHPRGHHPAPPGRPGHPPRRRPPTA